MYAIIDIESNGSGFRKERIIEVALFIYNGHKVIEQFISLVNPEDEITPFVQKLTGITPKMVKKAPKFHEIAKRIIEMTTGAILVGHNVDFDYRMLRQSFQNLGYDFQINTIDTIALSKKLIPNAESYSLGKLCKSIGIPHSDVHRAVGDARATLELFKLLISKDVENEIIQSHQEEVKSKSYTSKIKELTENLPSGKGIIYFQNKKGKIIFCDFTDNIYKKAKKILNSKSVKNTKIQQEVEQIYYEFTGNDIIAQLILQEKKIVKKYPQKLFSIVFNKKKGKFSITTQRNADEVGLFRFRYFSQAERFFDFLQTKEGGLDWSSIKKDISFSGRNEIWIGKGRAVSEKSFLAFRNGKFIGYGFYELYHQILSWDKILKLLIPINSLRKDIKNEMLISYLKGDFKIVKITD